MPKWADSERWVPRQRRYKIKIKDKDIKLRYKTKKVDEVSKKKKVEISTEY